LFFQAARRRLVKTSTLVSPNRKVFHTPMRHVWIFNHSQWCVHPSKLSPFLQLTSGHCMVRRPYDHPVVLPSRRCTQASLPLLSLLPKKLCQQRLLFPAPDLKAFIQRKVRCIGCKLPHSQCPLLPWASALSSDVRFLDFVPTPGCWFQILADPTARTTQIPSAARRLLTFTASVWSHLSPKRKKLEQARVYDHAGCLPNRRHHFE
jgi:hypothetical protein